MKMKIKMTELTVQNIRFESTSAAYITIHTNDPRLKGHGFTFIHGSHKVSPLAAMSALKHLIIDKDLSAVTEHMGEFWQTLINSNELHDLGADKTIMSIATATIINAVWDLWARREKKPLWRLIIDMSPEEVIRCLDFNYISDALTPDEALDLLRHNGITKGKRIAELLASGYPAHTKATPWPINATMGVNEILTNLLMAAKFNTPINPLSSDIGLSEYLQHLAMVDYIYISGSLENRVLEYVDYLHEHVREPAVVKNGHCQVPTAPGYSIEIKESSLSKYHYPHGEVWKTP